MSKASNVLLKGQIRQGEIGLCVVVLFALENNTLDIQQCNFHAQIGNGDKSGKPNMGMHCGEVHEF